MFIVGKIRWKKFPSETWLKSALDQDPHSSKMLDPYPDPHIMLIRNTASKYSTWR
jgi:hypothetical protein